VVCVRNTSPPLPLLPRLLVRRCPPTSSSSSSASYSAAAASSPSSSSSSSSPFLFLFAVLRPLLRASSSSSSPTSPSFVLVAVVFAGDFQTRKTVTETVSDSFLTARLDDVTVIAMRTRMLEAAPAEACDACATHRCTGARTPAVAQAAASSACTIQSCPAIAALRPTH